MSYSNSESNFLTAEQGGKAFSIMIAIYALLSFLVQSILLIFVSKESFAYIAVCSVLSLIAILSVIIYQIKYNKCTYKVLNVNKCNKTSFALAVIISVGMFCGLGFVNISIIELLQNLSVSITSPTIVLDNVYQFVYFVFALAILPAIIEELFFRGLFLNSLSGQSVLSKALIVGLFFALYHCNLGQFIYQFIYGALLTLLTVYAKSTLPAMITHFLNNFVALLFTYLKVSVNLLSPILIACGLACIVFALVVMIIKLKKTSEGKANSNVKGVFMPYGILGVTVCVLMLVSVFFV